ncbi:MAG: CHAT domain-containing protein [Oculatellaceae cyanobacterium Prado106]|nr:CHAT domain-containing protein [Oculatellaceae cyanobacterium Prado106]
MKLQRGQFSLVSGFGLARSLRFIQWTIQRLWLKVNPLVRFILILGLTWGWVVLLSSVAPALPIAHRFLAPQVNPHSQPIAQSVPDAAILLQEGIDLYGAARYSEAIAHWQPALDRFTAAQDPLNQAFVLSNLSLAYQQLGQWTEATEAIAQSLSLAASLTPASPITLEVYAKALNTHGRLQWFQGQSQAALTTWQQASQTYQQAGDQMGYWISSLNQAKALQTLGLTTQAATALQQIDQALQTQSSPQMQAIGLRRLGNVWRQMGDLSASEESLRQSLSLIEAHQLSSEKSATLLELANTTKAMGDRAIAIGQPEEGRQHLDTALQLYQQITDSTSQLPALLNQLQIFIALQRTSDVEPLVPKITEILGCASGCTHNVSLVSRTQLFAQLNFAKSLMLMRSPSSTQIPSSSVIQTIDLEVLLQHTVQQAQQLGDPIVESYALGQLGNFYEQNQQWQAAEDWTRKAWLKAEAAQAIDARYRWEWQLGRLQKQRGDRTAAIASYNAAVTSLQTIRNDLLRINADVQFSFRDTVEPIYREYVALLVSDKTLLTQATLQQAIRQVDALQLAELENFLGCNLGSTIALDQATVTNDTAKVYPLMLPDRLAVVLDLPGQPLMYHETQIPHAEVVALLQTLREDLQAADRTPEAIAALQTVHTWLIAPFQTVLAQQPQITSLVFVLDGELRNIPMAALHDGQQYLIQSYAVAVAPRLALFEPSVRSPNLQVFLGGIGEPQTFNNQQFAPITYLKPELEQIQKIANAPAPLLDANFTKSNLERQLQRQPFSIIHLKTHGVFSSEPESTFIVAYQELITGVDLGRLLQTQQTGSATIELLVLSACSTAQGDSRAVLGMAGIAVQAGARSVVSTLWEAQDLPNTSLMVDFYQLLSDPSLSRAEALRQAQLSLIERGFATPHIWATYVLVGNWL